MATLWVTCKAFSNCSTSLNYEMIILVSTPFRSAISKAQRRLISGIAALFLLGGSFVILLSSGVLSWFFVFEIMTLLSRWLKRHLDNARWRPVAAIALLVSLTAMALLSPCLG